MRDKEYFKDLVRSLLENHGLNALQECINGIEDTSIQKTFITFLNAAKEGDKEAEELLIDHLAGWMENRRRQIEGKSMTEPKTDSEFDYSSINVMAIGVMAMITIMIFFFFFFVFALVISQP